MRIKPTTKLSALYKLVIIAAFGITLISGATLFAIILTYTQNNFNTKPLGKVNIKGVYLYKNKFRATIRINKKSTHLGVFNTAEEAGEAYKKAAEKYHGEFAYHNRPLDKTDSIE